MSLITDGVGFKSLCLFLYFYRACYSRLPTRDVRASAWYFFFSFLLCAVGSGRTGEPGEGVVDVAVGRLTYGSAPQSTVPLRWHGCLASTRIISWQSWSHTDRERLKIGCVTHL